MIECDQKKIRLLILSIDTKKRKYVWIQLKNSDLLKFKFKIFNQNEIIQNAFEDRISTKRDNVRTLHQTDSSKNRAWLDKVRLVDFSHTHKISVQ
jgi:hypothetical protein